MAGIYLNDIPIEVFLEYFNSTEAEDTDNTIVTEQVKIIPTTYNNLCFPYNIEELTDSTQDPDDYFGDGGSVILNMYNYFQNVIGYNSSDAELSLYTCPLITRAISNDGLMYFNNQCFSSSAESSGYLANYSGVESDGITYNTIITYTSENSNYTYTDSPTPYAEPYQEVRTFNPLVVYTLLIDDDDPEKIYYSQEEWPYSDYIDIATLTEWSEEFETSSSDYLMKYFTDENGDTFSVEYHGQVTYFGTYDTHLIQSSVNGDNTRYYCVVSEAVTVPKLTSNGENLYRDSDGLLTTKSSYSNNFFSHQTAMRRAFSGIKENIGWTYNVSPRELVLVKKGKKEYFEYYDQFKKVSDVYSFTDSIPTDDDGEATVPVTTDTLSYSIYSKLLSTNSENSTGNYNKTYEDTSVAATYKLTHELISFSDYPTYDAYIDGSDSLAVTKGFEFFSEGLSNSRTALVDTNNSTDEFDAVVNFYTRKASLKSDPTSYINISSSAEAATVSDSSSEAQQSYLKDSVKFYAVISSTSSDKITVPEYISTTVVVDKTAISTKIAVDLYESTSIFNPESDEPYIIFNMFSDRSTLISNIGKYVHIVLKSDGGGTVQITGKIEGSSSNAATCQINFGNNIICDCLTEEELLVQFETTLTDSDGNEINTELSDSDFYFIAYPLGAIEKTLETTIFAKVQRAQYSNTNTVTDTSLTSTSTSGVTTTITNGSVSASKISSLLSQVTSNSVALTSSAYAALQNASSSSTTILSANTLASVLSDMNEEEDEGEDSVPISKMDPITVSSTSTTTYTTAFSSMGTDLLSPIQATENKTLKKVSSSTSGIQTFATTSSATLATVTYYYENRFEVVDYADVPTLIDPIYANGHSEDVVDTLSTSTDDDSGLLMTTYTADLVYYENPYNYSGAAPKYVKKLTKYTDYSDSSTGNGSSNNTSSFSSIYMDENALVTQTIQQEFKDKNKYYIEGADTLRGDYISGDTFKDTRKTAIKESLLRFLQGSDELVSLSDESNRSNGYITTYNYCKGLLLLVQKDLERGYDQVVRSDNKKTIDETDLTLSFKIDSYDYDSKSSISSTDDTEETTEDSTSDTDETEEMEDEYLESITTIGKGKSLSDTRNLVERMAQYKEYPLGYVYLEYLKNMGLSARSLDDTSTFENINMGYYNKNRKTLVNEQKTYISFSDILEKYADMLSRFYESGSQYYFDAINNLSENTSSATGYTRLFKSKFKNAKENSTINTTPENPTLTYKSVYFSDTDQDIDDLIHFLIAGGETL